MIRGDGGGSLSSVCGASDFLWVARVDEAGLGQGLWKTRTVGLAVKVSGAGDPHGPWFPVQLPSDTHVQGLLRFGVGG